MDKKWWLLYCWVWKRNKEYEERVLLIVLVVIDCGVGTTVNTTILLMYILIYIMFNFCLLKYPWKSWWWWCVSNQSGTNLRICPRPCWIQWLKKIIYVLPKVFEKNGPKQYVRGVSPPFIGGLYIIGPAVGTVIVFSSIDNCFCHINYYLTLVIYKKQSYWKQEHEKE